MAEYRRVYVPGGTYFLTVVTYQRYPFFRDPNAVDLFRRVWVKTQKDLPFESIGCVLLHDHFHCLWGLPAGDNRYSVRIKKIKERFTSDWLSQGGCEVLVTSSQKGRGNRGVWQKRFWEHTIRDERDFEMHLDYIHFNPVKHGYCKRASEWPYSTFHRYVATGYYPSHWGSTCPEHIKKIDLE